ncbi:MAG: thioredoxin domain-containing protein, partial [Thiobacillaceae bacterium]
MQLLPAMVQAGNRLAGHPSPYLAQHGKDPVHWREWGPGVLEEARRGNRLILVSLGYYACHWCHVMQRETWADAGVARFVNANFIAVKVDRELNAGLDAALQGFAERTRGVAGWPLNVFLTPDGHPLFAITYAPRDEFLQVSRALAERWRRESGALSRLAREAAKPASRRVITDLPGAFLNVARAEADMMRGGFGQTAKFPMAPQLMALLEMYARKPDAELEEILRLTLGQMITGGLRDHVAGGFFRYTVDPDWHEPHFEKMLYDNALLALVYLRAAEVLGEPLYRRIGLQTVDFMLAEMGATRGSAAEGLVASLSALDDKDREGGGYLWSREDLKRILNAGDYALAERIWGLDRAAVFELGYLPQEVRPANGQERARLKAVLTRLRSLRRDRVIPRDVKVLTGWNGLALAALTAAARVEPRYRKDADALFAFVRARLWDGRRLVKGVSGGKALGIAELEDYAYLAYGVSRYAALSGGAYAQRFLHALLESGWKRFHDGKDFRMEEASLLAQDHA